MSKVSVIIPVYGVEKYVERCARSLFEQTLDDIEYLFIDDCTPDKSVDVLKRVLDDYPNRKEQVIIHRMECNSGQAAVRKWGMQNATGEYIIHCDSDDWVNLDMYRAMYEKGVNEDADLVICHYYNATSQDKKVSRQGFTIPTYNAFMWDMLYARVPWALWNKLFKRNCLKSIVEYPLHNMGEDMAIVFQIMTNVSKISVVNNPFYNYRINNPLSITNDITDPIKASKIMSIFYDMISNENIVSRVWTKKSSYNNFQKGFCYLKLNVKYLIKPLIGEEKYYIIWKQTYPGIDSKILCDCHIPWRIRFRSLLSLMNIYHICVKFKHRIL